MKIGIIKPTYPNEMRVAILPEHIHSSFENELIIEEEFGKNLSIHDNDYVSKGCKIDTRESIYKNCDVIFCLKLIQPDDYKFIRDGQMIIGWTHPFGSGSYFYNNIAIKRKLVIVDLDNIYPTIYYNNNKYPITFIDKNFIWKNSFYAGYASVQHALLNMGILPDNNTKVAVLSNGSVSQGAYNYISKFCVDIRMFYRKTMNEFYRSIDEYDVIINGIEVDNPDIHIISWEDLQKIKKGCLLIDSAADAGNAIEGTRFTTINNPIYEEDGLFYYIVNNAPSLIYRKTSYEISKSFSKYIFEKDVKRFYDLIK